MEHLVESGQIVQVRAPAAGPNDDVQNGAWVDLTQAQWVYLTVNTAEGAATNYTLRVLEFDGTTTRAMQNNVNIWHDDDGDGLVRQTDGVTLAVDGSSADKVTVFSIDPARVSSGYDRVTLQVDSTPGNQDTSAQIISAVANVIPARYKSATG